MMKHICCYSGGHSSALVPIEVARRFGSENMILLNHDISGRVEGADVKRFKREVAEYLGVEITYANAPNWDTKDQFDVVLEAGAFKVGNGTALCTSRMKTQPFEKWLKQNISDKSQVVIYYGYDKGETGRIQRRSSHLASLGFRSDYPLALWENRTIFETSEIGITRPNTYDLFKHGNCTGCLKAGRQHWYVVFCTRPDIWEKAKMSEDEIGYTIIKGVSLEDLEPLFTQMRAIGIPATEHIPAARFWADAKKKLASCPIEDDQTFPCECAA